MDEPKVDQRRCTPARAVGWAAVALAGTLVWFATRRGPGISNDSVAYLATAQHLAHEGRLTNFDGQRLSIFPPGYSTVIAGMLRVGFRTQVTVQVLGIVTALVVVAATRRLARGVGSTPMGASVAALFVAVNTGLVLVHSMAWSEPMFVAATLVALIALTHLHRVRALHPPTVVVLALATGLAGVTRYAGIVLILVIGGVVLVDHWAGGVLRAVRRAVLVAAACSWGIVAVVAVNVTDGRPPMGQRGGGKTYGPDEVMGQIATTLGRYVLGPDASRQAWLQLGAVLLGALLVGAVAAAIRLARRPSAVWSAPVAPVVVYVLASTAFLAVSEMTTMLNAIDARLFAPVFAPLVVVVALPIDRAIARWLERPTPGRLAVPRRPALAALSVAALVVLLGTTAADTVAWSSYAGTHSQRLNAVRERTEPWVEVVDALPPGAAVVADDPYSVRWLGAHEPVTPVPGRAFYAWVPFRERLIEVRAFVTDHGGGYLVLTEGPNQRVIDAFRWVGLDVQPYRVEEGLEVYTLAPPVDPGAIDEGTTP